MEETWELWKENICFEGVYLDTVLKQKIEDEGRKTRFQKYGMDSRPPYFNEYSVYCRPGEKYHHVCYLWLESRLWNEVYCRLDQTFLRRDEIIARITWNEPRYVGFKGTFRREVDNDGRYINQIEIITDTNGLEYLGNNDLQFVSFDNISEDGLEWGNEVKNLKIEINDEVLANNRYIDIPIMCYSCKFLLRILISPYSFCYEVKPDGSVWLDKCFTKYKPAVTIPSMIDGKTVSRIGKRRFYNCKGVISVTISEGVNSIGSFAFEGCTSLEKINIPNSVEDIGRHAFRCCDKLSSVMLLGTIKEIRSYTFYRCRSLTEFIVPEGCERIGYRAFCGSSLVRVVVSKTVKEIGDAAFKCDNLCVALPSSLEDWLMARAKRCWVGGKSWEEEMDFPVAWDIFARKSPFNRKGTLLVFYDNDYQVVKKIVV